MGKTSLYTFPLAPLSDIETEVVLADLVENEQKVLVAKGGRGGLGNVNFKTSTNQAPRKFTYGKPNQVFEINLGKLLADIALVGQPNAGKSTLISEYLLLNQNLLTILYNEANLAFNPGEESFVVADIPGLIEDASLGKGLGIKFLKHIEEHQLSFTLSIALVLNEFEA